MNGAHDPESPPLSDDEQSLVNFATALISALRQSQPAESQKPPGSRIVRILEALGGATLITAVLGIAGTFVTGAIQKNAAYNERMVSASKEYIQQEQEVVKRAYELIGSNISAADDIIELTGEDYDLDKYAGTDRTAVKKQRRDMRDNYNTFDVQWRNEQEKLGLLMTYYHNGNPEVMRSWKETQKAAQAFKDCAESWHNNYENGPLEMICLKDACTAEKDVLLGRLEVLTNVLETARKQSWKNWESDRPSIFSIGSETSASPSPTSSP